MTPTSGFPGGPGRTTTPADLTSLMDDLEERVFGPMEDATWIYPGHGKDTTLGAERPHLGEWRVRGWEGWAAQTGSGRRRPLNTGVLVELDESAAAEPVESGHRVLESPTGF